MVSAAYRPPLAIVPPDALQLTATATLSPACVRPYATNCCVWSGSSVTVSGEETICTTGLFGGVGSVTRTGSSHAVNGIAPTPPHTKGPPASTRGRFAGGPADLASSGSP